MLSSWSGRLAPTWYLLVFVLVARCSLLRKIFSWLYSSLPSSFSLSPASSSSVHRLSCVGFIYKELSLPSEAEAVCLVWAPVSISIFGVRACIYV